MSSINFCLKKFGAVTDADAVAELVKSGLTEEQAVNQQIANIDSEIDSIAQQVTNQGGRVANDRGAPITADEFHDNLIEALTASPNGASAYAYTADEYATMKLVSYDDGRAGFAIRRDGMIVSLYKHPDSQLKGVVDLMIQEAVEQGGTRLEAFEGFLTESYGRNGFVEADRYSWDENMAPDNWDAETMGKPDVLAMTLDKGLYDEARENQSANTEGLQDLGRARTSDGRVRRESRLSEKQNEAIRGREADGSLKGLPRQVGGFNASAWANAASVAQEYMANAGLEYLPPSNYVKVDPERSAKIAQAFDGMDHAPNDPEVAAAYTAMINETIEQYRAIVNSGLKVEFIDGADPYESSPRMMTDDVRDNNHMYVFSTREGFGSDDNFDPVDNPLLLETDFKISGQVALANDLFRVVHDYFGHVKEGVGFRADGEENTWRSHISMYSPLARKAVTTETRGQNSWVNYGPYGETNRSATAENTVFADQKIGILPDWVMDDSQDLHQQGTPDLDMSDKARMRRAKDMGFDINTTYYHGSPDSRGIWDEGFDKKGSVGIGENRPFFFSSDKRLASSYADDNRAFDYQNAVAETIPVRLKMTNPKRIRWDGGGFRGKRNGKTYSIDEEINIAREQGHDGLIVDNIRDEYAMTGAPGNVTVVFEPSQIRSVNAAFDPALEDSSRLLYQSQTPVNELGFYSGVNKAVMDMNFPQWKKGGKQLTEVESARLDELNLISYNIKDDNDPLAIELAALEQKQRVSEGLVSGAEILAKLKKTGGVKEVEVKWLGLNEFLQLRDKYTRDEVMEFVQENGLEVVETVADELENDQELTTLEWDSGTIWDDPEAWDHDIEYYSDEAEDNGILDRVVESLLERNSDRYNEEKEDDESAVEYFTRLDDEYGLTDEVRDEAESMAEEAYMYNPVYIYSAQNDGVDLFIFGNDEQGYSIRKDDWRNWNNSVTDIEIYSLNEAEIQAENYAREEELIGYADDQDGNVAKWSDYNIEDTPWDNYREIKLQLPQMDSFYHNVHFDEENIVAFLRVTDRDLYVTPRRQLTKEERAHVEHPDNAEIQNEIEAVEKLLPAEFDRIQQLLKDNIKDEDAHKFEEKLNDYTSWEGIASAIGLDESSVSGYRMMKKSITNLNDLKFKNNTPLNSTEARYGRAGIEKANTYFIDEYQSDWASEGREQGFKTGERDVIEMEEEVLALSGALNNEILSKYSEFVEPYLADIEEELGLSDPESEFNKFVFSNKFQSLIKSNFQHIKEGYEGAILDKIIDIAKDIEAADKEWLYGLRDRIKQIETLDKAVQGEQNGVSDMPLKGDLWIPFGLKRAITDAIENGYEAIAWPNNEALQQRWSRSYNYEAQYDKKMPSVMKKLMGETPVQLTFKGGEITDHRDNYTINKVPFGKNGHKFEVRTSSTAGEAAKTAPLVVDTKADAEKHINSLLRGRDKIQSGYWTIPITDKLKADVQKSGFPLYQEYRGSFNPETMVMKLGESSDLSTFLHESAHFFLEMEKQFVRDYGNTDDHETLLKWLNVSSLENITVEHHEKFAETFEAYLRTGKSPSAKLRNVFTEFADWLSRIYKTLIDSRLTRSKLDPEITGVMDRLLATKAEIESELSSPQYDELFRSKEQAGMTDKQWEKYQQDISKRKTVAQGDINDKVLKEYRKRLSKEWRKEESEIRDAEIERLDQTPPYRLIKALKTYKMNKAEIHDIVDTTTLTDAQRRKLNSFVSDNEAAMNPVEVAEEFEFENAQDMVATILGLTPVKEAAKVIAEQKMKDKYGDFINDGSLEAEVRQAVRNDQQAKILMHEIKALDKKSKINRTYLKDEAARMIASMKFGEIRPNKYYRNEIKAAQDAVTAKSADEKLHAKTRQLANHYLYKEALATKEKIEKHRKYIKNVQSFDYGSTVEASYVANMKMLSESYDMRKNPDQPRNVESLINWMITQTEDINNFVSLEILDVNLATMLSRRDNGETVNYTLPTWEEMTAAEIKSVHDMLKHMRFVGGQLSDTAKVRMGEERQSAADSVKANARETIVAKHVEKKTDRIKDGVKRFLHSHRRLAGLFFRLDGFEYDGELAKQYDKVVDAGNVELELTGVMTKDMDNAFKKVYKKISRRNEATVTKSDGENWTLTHRARFVLALNWGNDGNREAVLEGLNNKFEDEYTAEDVMAMMSTMGKDELNAVNAVWIAKEQLWPKMSAVSVRMTGVTPAKVVPSSFKVNGVHMVGGHYKLHYMEDPNDAGRKDLEVDKNIQKQSISMSQLGTMIARKGSGGRQVDLELQHLFTDIGEDIHYIAYAEMAKDLSRVLKGSNNPLVAAIQRHHGVPFYKNLIDTVDGIINPPDASKGVFWPGLKWVRGNLTYAYLAGSVRNVVQQPIALTNVLSQLGEIHTIKGIMNFYANPVDNWTKVREESMFMAHRTELVNREAREQLAKMDSIHPTWGAIKQGAFAPQTFMDSLIAFPAWMGARDKYMADHPDADVKKAIKYADEMVAKTVGSGMTKDIGNILNATEAEKQITFMGTFFNVTYNLHVENMELLKSGKINGFEYAKRVGWMAIAPALLSVWLLSDLPDDPDEVPMHLMKEVAFYNFSSIFLIRDLMSVIDGFTPSLPGLQFGTGAVRVANEVTDVATGDEELDMNTVASIIRGLQPLAPLPGSGQVARTLEGISDENQTTWGSLVEGKDRN